MTDATLLERNKDLLRRFVDEVWNGGHLDRIPDLVGSNFRCHHPRNRDADIYGVSDLEAQVEMAREAIADLHMSTLLLLADGDRVMAYVAVTGTSSGSTSGSSAGRSVSFTATAVLRLAEGRIAESWVIFDTLGLLGQLGMIRWPL